MFAYLNVFNIIVIAIIHTTCVTCVTCVLKLDAIFAWLLGGALNHRSSTYQSVLSVNGIWSRRELLAAGRLLPGIVG